MATNIKSGHEITIGTTQVEYQFSDIPIDRSKEQVISISVHEDNSGTIQFAVGRDVEAADRAAVAGEKRVMTIVNGFKNLRADASSAGQKFTVDY
jgi:hypothetical protein